MALKVFSAVAAVALFAMPGPALAGKNYSIIIDGTAYDIDADEKITAKTKSGQDIEILLKKSEFGTFSKGGLSFEHPGNLSVAATDLEQDIHQYLVASALGTLLLVQKYDKLNASSLTPFMLQQITSDDVKAGATLEQAEHSRTLADGTVMKGLRATIKSPRSNDVVEVLGADDGYSGVLAVTRIDLDIGKAEQPLIDRFWSSLKLK